MVDRFARAPWNKPAGHVFWEHTFKEEGGDEASIKCYRSAVRDGVDLLFTINSKSIVLTSREAKALHSMLIKAQASNG